MNLLELKNPIPQNVEDEKRIRQLFRKLKLVPYGGSSTRTGHKYQQFLRELSGFGSQAACINDIDFYAFEGDLDIMYKRKAGLKVTSEAEPGDAERNAFAAWIEESTGNEFIDILSKNRKLFRNWAENGNCYLHYREVEINDTKQVVLTPIHPENIAFLLRDNLGQPKTIAIFKTWDIRELKDNPPKLIRVFPSFTNRSNGRETIFHLRTSTNKSDYYGRPISEGSLYWQYVEYLAGLQSMRSGTTDVVAKKALAFEMPPPMGHRGGSDDDPDADNGVRKRANELRKLTTMEGSDPKTLVAFEYDNGTKPPQVIDLEIFRDKEWFSSQIDTASAYVYASWRWKTELTGFRQAKSNLGGNVLIDIFKISDRTVIRPLQQMMSNFWYSVTKTMADFFEDPEMAGYAFKFPSNITELIEELQPASDNQTPEEDGNDIDEQI